MSYSDLPKSWTTSLNISKFVLSKHFFCVKIWSNLSGKKNPMKNIWLGDQLLLKNVFENFNFLKFCSILLALFIILVSLTMTRFSEKMLIFTKCTHGFMSNLIKNSWTDSKNDPSPQKRVCTVFCVFFFPNKACYFLPWR